MYKELTYLRSIIDSIDEADLHKNSGAPDKTIESALLYTLAIIGEAVTHISEETREKYPHVPWRKIVANRNVLIHDYLGVDYEVMWGIIENHLPDLRRNISKIIQDMENNNG